MDDNGLFDNESMQRILERMADNIRGLGLSLMPGAMIMVDPETGDQVLNCSIMIRSSAKERLDRDRAESEAFNSMMAQNAAEAIREKANQIAQEAASKDSLASALFGDDDDACTHENRHPEGFCLDCGDGMQL